MSESRISESAALKFYELRVRSCVGPVIVHMEIRGLEVKGNGVTDLYHKYDIITI